MNQFTDIEEGNWALISNECWGVAPRYADDGITHDGYVVACGTGIMGCALRWNRGLFLVSECKADPRNTWRGLTVATDLDGERVYSRLDSY